MSLVLIVLSVDAILYAILFWPWLFGKDRIRWREVRDATETRKSPDGQASRPDR